jgi:hypothetical protein
MGTWGMVAVAVWGELLNLSVHYQVAGSTMDVSGATSTAPTGGFLGVAKKLFASPSPTKSRYHPSLSKSECTRTTSLHVTISKIAGQVHPSNDETGLPQRGWSTPP